MVCPETVVPMAKPNRMSSVLIFEIEQVVLLVRLTGAATGLENLDVVRTMNSNGRVQ